MRQSSCWVLLAGCLLAAAASPTVATAAGGKVYALVVIDTDAPRLGEKFLKHDRVRIVDLLDRGFPHGSCKYTILQGHKDGKATRKEERPNRTAILDYLKNLKASKKVTKDDTVLFYFTGHGKTKKGEHILQVFGSGREEKLQRSELRKAMRDVGAGLVVIWTDACAAHDDDGEHDAELPESKFAPDKVPAGFRRLFFETRGVVDINAAEEGTEAACDSRDGGLFTRTLWTHLDKNMTNKDVNWGMLYASLKKDTEKSFKELKIRIEKKGKKLPGGLGTQEKQTAFAFYMPSTTGMLIILQRDATKNPVGFRVAEVWGESPAQRAGLRRGEVIIEMNGKAAHTLWSNSTKYKEYFEVIRVAQASPGKKLRLKVRDSRGNTREISLDLSRR